MAKERANPISSEGDPSKYPLSYAPRNATAKSNNLSAVQVARFALFLGTIGLLTITIALPLRSREAVSILAAIGCMPAILGMGAGIWAALRMRSLYVFCVTIPAIVATAGWVCLALVLMRR